MRRLFDVILVCLGLLCLGAFPAFADDWEVWVPDGSEAGLSDFSGDSDVVDYALDDDEDLSGDEEIWLIDDVNTPSDAVVSTPSSAARMMRAAAPVALASSYNPYDSSMSSSVVAFFDDYVQRIVGKHYVLFRSGQYDYRFVYGSDLSLSGSVFSGTDCNYVAYSTRYYTWDTGSEGNFSLSAGSYLVYSDLGDYPPLGADSIASWVVAFVAVAYFLFVIFRSFFAPQSFRLG